MPMEALEVIFMHYEQTDGNEGLVDNASLAELAAKLAEAETKMAALHKPGSVVTMKDGQKYRVHSDGSWRKEP